MTPCHRGLQRGKGFYANDISRCGEDVFCEVCGLQRPGDTARVLVVFPCRLAREYCHIVHCLQGLRVVRSCDSTAADCGRREAVARCESKWLGAAFFAGPPGGFCSYCLPYTNQGDHGG